ncbi:MAG: hypothetical protein LQ349_008094, partial [Xanthoria aureola]
MDGLSTAAGGFAVVSVALQLADGIKKLHDFWNSITEAPEDIKENLDELRLLSDILIQMARDGQRHTPDRTFADVLSVCYAKVKGLTSLLEEFEPGFASRSSYIRRWTAVKAIMKQEKLKKFEERLARLKSTLSLARQLEDSRLSQDQYIFITQSLVTLTQHPPVSSIQENQRYAARSFHPELCKFLDDSGADKSAPTYNARTPLQVAVSHNSTLYASTYAILSNISDTFRLLIESMDFMDHDGSGWFVLLSLCDAATCSNGEPAARMALLVWMLKLLGSEIKMSGSERHYARLLSYTLLYQDTGRREASRLLLRLGGSKPMDKPLEYDGGFTILHCHAAYAEDQGGIRVVLALCPDIHPLGHDHEISPEEESPFSLVLYSSWAFEYWLNALASIGKGFEQFLTEEIERNHTIYLGWKKETLLNLGTYNDGVAYVHPSFRPCADCAKRFSGVAVQPHWRHFLERIKHGIDPYYSSAEATSEVDEEESVEGRSIAESGDNTNAPTNVDDVNSEMEAESETGSVLELESGWESKWQPEWSPGESDPHVYPATISLESDCVYCPHE